MNDEGLQGKNSILSALHVFNESIISIKIFALFNSQNVYHILSNKVAETPTY
jgi:hypothetical protein